MTHTFRSKRSDGRRPGGPSEAKPAAGRLYLKEYRRRAGVTLKQVGEHLGLHFTAVQKWETQVSSPPARDLFRIAERYGVHPAALFLDPDGFDKAESIGLLQVHAKLAGVHPAAQLLTGGDLERLRMAEQLTRFVAVLERNSPKWIDRWLKLAEITNGGSWTEQ